MKSRWELILMNLITVCLNNRSMNLQLRQDQVQLYNIPGIKDDLQEQ